MEKKLKIEFPKDDCGLIIELLKEKIKSLNDFFFRKSLNFEVKENKLIFNLNKEDTQLKNLIELLKDKYKEMLNLEVEVKVGEVKEEKKKEDKKSQ